MKKIKFIQYCLLLTAHCIFNKAYSQPSTLNAQPLQKLTSYVNPFIGTGGHGHTFPGPTLPFGACQVGPDTRLTGWDGCSGYHYSDSIIYGFSHTHLSGTGCSDYGDILLMPTTEEVMMKDYDYASSFSHKNESAGAGYYNVHLDNWNIDVNLTCTKRVGIHQYNFPENNEQYVVLDLKHRDEVLDSKLEIVNDSTLKGYRFSKAWAKNQKVYYYIQFSRPFIEKRYSNDIKSKSETGPIFLEKQQHAIFVFGKSDKPLLVKVGISGVDVEGAENNVTQEARHWNFNQYKKAADSEWEKELGKIKIEQLDISTIGQLDNKTIGQFDNVNNQVNSHWQTGLPTRQVDSLKNCLIVFYTALYHCMIHPSIYNDVDGRYRGRDDKIHNTKGKFDYYTVFSLWDTYRALHPLLTIIDRKRTNDFINTFIKQYEQGGRLPIWELSSNETNCMIGYHVVSVIWDAYNKGIRDYDVNKAYEAMKDIATDYNDYTTINSKNQIPNSKIESTNIQHLSSNISLKKEARERCADGDALESYCRYGYVRSDDSHESVSKTLEYAYDDWCIAQMANALNKKKDYEYYLNRSHNWRNVYDPTTGFMRARKNGTLYEPFSPYTVDNNFTEANSWQYSFYVPHEMYNLIYISKGKEKFKNKLDDLFSAKEKTEGREHADITGLIGQYAHGNEPSHHISYLYNYIYEEEITAQKVNFIRNDFYKNSPDGLIGNEDCGQMSAWYVLTSLGIYPTCPGRDEYQISEPLFNKLTLLKKIILKKNNVNTGFDGNYYTINDRQAISHTNFIAAKSHEFKKFKEENYSKFQKENWDKDNFDMVNFIHPFPSVPFIINTKRTFQNTQKIEIQSATPTDEIYYSLNDGSPNKYTSPFYINDNVSISFYGVNVTNCSPIQTATFTKLPNDRKVILKSTFNKSYSAGGAEAMIDGIYGKLNWRAGDWQGYQGQDVETIIAFDKPKKITSLSANYLEDQNSWIFYPKEVSFYVSNDSINWTLIETIPTNKSNHEEKTTISKFTANCKLQTANYVKVVSKNFGPMPQWHEGRGNETFVFMDEIEVN